MKNHTICWILYDLNINNILSVLCIWIFENLNKWLYFRNHCKILWQNHPPAKRYHSKWWFNFIFTIFGNGSEKKKCLKQIDIDISCDMNESVSSENFCSSVWRCFYFKADARLGRKRIKSVKWNRTKYVKRIQFAYATCKHQTIKCNRFYTFNAYEMKFAKVCKSLQKKHWHFS